MTADRYPHLFSRIKIGPVELPNRVAMAPMGTGLVDSDGKFSWRQIEYYAARARGGTGLIIVEATMVAKEIDPSPFDIAISRADGNDKISRMSDMADVIKGTGAVPGLQLSLGQGRQADVAREETPPVAPSQQPAFADPGVECRSLSREEVEQMINNAADAAERALLAGFSLVELHGHAGYLIDQFLTPLWNQREDVFGGNPEGRFRLIRELLWAIRERVGNKMAVTFRISVDHKYQEGRSLEEGVELCKKLEDIGFDALHVDAGFYETMPWIFPPSYYGEACMVDLAARVKESVNIPVIAVGSILDPETAEKIIAEEKADLVALGRPLLADPDWAGKALEDRPEDIRTCILCNEFCIGRLFQHKNVSCSVNASCGKEFYFSRQSTARPRRVTVVGGGPAGMEAARVASRLGHQVILLEKENEPGGQLIPATRPHFKRPLKGFLDYLKRSLEREKVQVETGQTATRQVIRDTDPDEVILAAGAVPYVPDLPGIKEGMEEGTVLTAAQALTREEPVKNYVLVVGGGLVGCETALYLASGGQQVTIVEELDDIATDLNPISRLSLLEELQKAGVEIKTGLQFTGAYGGEINCLGRERETEKLSASTVVISLGYISRREMMPELMKDFPRVRDIGDCVIPRKVGDAVSEGFQAAWSLG